MRRFSLTTQVFLSLLLVSLSTAAIVGFFARTALSASFDRYLASLPSPMGPGRMMGRRLLGSAEQIFIASVDRGVAFAAVLAIAVAAVGALALAAYLARPIRQLESAAEEIAGGDLAHRVRVDGPSEVAALGHAFNAMADSLEEAEELRRRLVADVAHELRNPLAAARAQAEGMLDGVLEFEPARLDSLVEDLAQLSVLIDDLQELAVAEAGRMRYDMQPVDLGELALREARSARSLLQPGVRLELAVGDGPFWVQADERRLAQVIRNLLSNAARHTSRGAVTVAVSAENDVIVLTVTDTGAGIGPEDLEHVFERFYRADAARAGSTGGAGLGLAISRAIIRDHGGDVFASSSPGSGTIIGFRLPKTPIGKE